MPGSAAQQARKMAFEPPILSVYPIAPGAIDTARDRGRFCSKRCAVSKLGTASAAATSCTNQAQSHERQAGRLGNAWVDDQVMLRHTE